MKHKIQKIENAVIECYPEATDITRNDRQYYQSVLFSLDGERFSVNSVGTCHQLKQALSIDRNPRTRKIEKTIHNHLNA